MTMPIEPMQRVAFEWCKKVALSGSGVDQILSPIAFALQKIEPHDYAALAFRDEKAAGQVRSTIHTINGRN